RARKLRPGGAAGIPSSTWGVLWLAQDARTSAALVPDRCCRVRSRCTRRSAAAQLVGSPWPWPWEEEMGRLGFRAPSRRLDAADLHGDRRGEEAGLQPTAASTAVAPLHSPERRRAAASGARKKAGAGAAVSIEEREAACWILPEGREGGAKRGDLEARWILPGGREGGEGGRGGWRRGEGRWERS
uniref:Uncharacterized protein n=1 Tax=Aegilops tauschii subsp. strangulata TaxID=200361 RepID=A0A453EUV3_AEGTS